MSKAADKLPWIIKYRPKRVADVVDQDNAKKQFVEWILSWIRGKPTAKAALLYGPAGCGKTSLVEAVAKEYGFEIIEMNASDFRRREDIERIAKIAATQSSLFGARRKIILLDEVDGISGIADRGALDAILELISTTKHPIVMTANDPWDQKLRPLRENSLLIAFNRLPKRAVVEALRRICAAENLKCEDDALSYIADKSEGDLRSAINDLESIARGYGRVTYELARSLVRARDREYTPFETLRNLFMSKYAWQARSAITHSNLDFDTLMEWINENLPYQLSDKEDLWRAYEALSKADIYMGRIIKSGDWDLLSYVLDMSGAGVALSRKKSKFRWVKYNFPQKILRLAKTKEVREIRDALAKHLASHLSTSSATVKSDVLPFLRVIFLNNPQYAARIVIGYSLTDRMVKYLAPETADSILRIAEKLRKEKKTVAKTAEATKETHHAKKEKVESKEKKRRRRGQTTLF